jgi:hypothetical protein
VTAPYTEALGATIRVKSQAERRRTTIFTDQHGRDWSTEIEVEHGWPCVAMTPAGWRAPHASLVPPQKYMTFRPGRYSLVFIDYDAWIIDATDGNREYDQHLHEVAKMAFNSGAIAAIQRNDPELLKLAGPAPMAIQFIHAMKSGTSKWALGILKPDGTRYPMPPWAAPLFDSLKRIETYGGSDANLDAFADMDFSDVEDDDAVERAERMAENDQYADLEDAVDPQAEPNWQPTKRGRGRPKKLLTE